LQSWTCRSAVREFLRHSQAGLPDFRVANLVRDRQLLELAKLEAARFANPPSLDQAGSSETTEPERARVWARLKTRGSGVWPGGSRLSFHFQAASCTVAPRILSTGNVWTSRSMLANFRAALSLVAACAPGTAL